MSIERLQLKGMLVEAKKEFRSLDIEASGLIILIRSLLNPYEEVLKTDTDKVSVSVKRLVEVAEKMKSLNEKIKNLEKEFE